MRETMHIVSVADNNYAQHLGVMLCSLFENNKDDSIEIHVIDGGIDAKNLSKLSRIQSKYDFIIHYIRPDHSLFQGAPIKYHLNETAYYRLQISDLIPKDIKKILYLDCDLIVNGDLMPLWNSDLDSKTIGAVWDPGIEKSMLVKLNSSSEWFNSGVMLIDMESWHRENIGKQCLDIFNKNKDRLVFADQDILNVALENKWQRLSSKYNNMISQGFVDHSDTEPSIIHYVGSLKPWHYLFKHSSKKYYYKYLRKSPWIFYTPPDMTYSRIKYDFLNAHPKLFHLSRYLKSATKFILSKSSTMQNVDKKRTQKAGYGIVRKTVYDASLENHTFTTPILLIVFNRPDTTKRVLEGIKEVKPKYLYIAADGPRAGVDADKEKVSTVRKMIDQIDWDCEIVKNYSETNLGCQNRPCSAIDWFFQHVDVGIILEDDCLPNRSFFYFCQELLERYANQTKIMMISGDNFQNGKTRGKYSYYFSRFPHCWGWATWRRSWVKNDIRMRALEDFKRNNAIKTVSSDKRVQEYWLNCFDTAKNSESIWDYQWAFAIFRSSGLCIVPNYNLVTNIGFGSDATHTTIENDGAANKQTAEIDSMTHPPSISIDKGADRYEELAIISSIRSPSFLKRTMENIIKCIKRIIKRCIL